MVTILLGRDGFEDLSVVLASGEEWECLKIKDCQNIEMERTPILRTAIGYLTPCLEWITGDPVWEERWSLNREKWTILHQLIKLQLHTAHIRPSRSPLNTPVFVMKTGTWRLLQHLRSLNKSMRNWGSPQRILLFASAMPVNILILVYLDIKDGFLSIPLHEQNCKHFTCPVPKINSSGPDWHKGRRLRQSVRKL